MNRRSFLRYSAAAIAARQLSNTALNALPGHPPASPVLTPWTPGYLEIHHLATNRGNSAFLILPDGTTMMVDAGALYGDSPYLSPPRPSAARRPGEWIGRYIQRRLKSSSLSAVDVCLITHLHPDHLGAIPPNAKPNTEGYIPTGVADVADIVSIHRYIDRDAPNYTYPTPATADFQQNYRAFLTAKQKSGAKVERFRVGANNQLQLQHDPENTHPSRSATSPPTEKSGPAPNLEARPNKPPNASPT